MNKNYFKFLPSIAILPAVLIGVFAMAHAGVSPVLYLQNSICALLVVISGYLWLQHRKKYRHLQPLLVIGSCLLAIALTFLDPGVDGVNRWLTIGPIQLYVSAIVVPIILIQIGILVQQRQIKQAIMSLLAAIALVALQPDAAMTTALSLAGLLIMWPSIKPTTRCWLSILVSTTAILTWLFLDSLSPVSYVEGIFELIIALGDWAFIVAIITLILMIGPFFVFLPTRQPLVAVALGCSYIVILLANLYGAFPVPLIGYGISPIIGYFIAIMWLARKKIRGE